MRHGGKVNCSVRTLFPWAATCFALLAFTLSGCRPTPPSPDDFPFIPSALESMILYEVFVRDFSDQGTFKAVENRLDELADLGVNALWLMPIHPNGELNALGTYGSPYAVKDYTDVHPDFGSMDDFRDLVGACHIRGMRILIDWVPNHTAWDHPWISAHPDWYTQDAQGNIVHPPGTNWMDVADLNYGQGGMRQAMLDAMRFWIADVGIDGFRCDYAEGVPQDFWEQAIAEMQTINPDVIMLAEGAAPWLHDAGMNMTYSWDGYGAIWQVFANGSAAHSIQTSFEGEATSLGPLDRRLRFSTNHDETSWDAPPPTLFGGQDGARSAQAIVTFLPGTPLVYNGQEVGSTQVLNLFERIPIDWSTNPEMRPWMTTLLTARRDHPALVYGDISFSFQTNVFRAERTYTDTDGLTHRALLVAHVREGNRTTDLSAWQGMNYADAWTGEAPPISQALGPHEVRLYLTP